MIPTQRINTGQTSISQTITAPVGGLNGRDSLANMAGDDAYFLDNWLPGTASCIGRNGCEEFAATVGSPVKSLAVYAGAAADKLLSFAGGKVYNISTGIPSELASGKLSDLIVDAMFSNSADNSQHLIITTGTDTPYRYDGTSITNLALTGMTGVASTLNYVFAFKGRLFFGQRDMLGFYYLASGAIQGALTYFDLAQVSAKGGYLVAIGSFSDGGSGEGPNDYIVFVTSKGECIVYAGYDPSSAANWVLVGRYFTAPPIGKKCLVNYDTELVILTLDGAIPFSQVRQYGAKEGGGTSKRAVAITDKLGKLLSDFNAYADIPGWEAVVYSRGGLLLLNVPGTAAVTGPYYQYAMNTKTNAWTRFTGWDCLCFAVFNRRLYFGKYDGRVMLADEGRSDDGVSIKLDCKQAYNYFEDGSGLGMATKHFQWADMFMKCDGEPPISGKFNVDFKENQPEYISTLAVEGAEWDLVEWDLAEWSPDPAAQHVLLTLNDAGIAGSLWLRAQLTGLTLEWYGTKFVMGKTKGLL